MCQTYIIYAEISVKQGSVSGMLYVIVSWVDTAISMKPEGSHGSRANDN